jgi:FAD/FMN-containing dehydrogenase
LTSTILILAPVFGHVGDGNLHVNIFFDPKNVGLAEMVEKAAEKLALHALTLGGTCTGEHGIGSDPYILVCCCAVFPAHGYVVTL